MAGIVLGWWYSRRLVANAALWGDRKRPTTTDMDDMIVWVALGIVLGGRVGYILFYNFDSYIENPAEIFTIWRGGMSFHGGLLGVTLALVLFARARALSFLSAARPRRRRDADRAVHGTAREFRQWRTLGTAGARLRLERRVSPVPDPFRVTRASSTRPLPRVSCCSS